MAAADTVVALLVLLMLLMLLLLLLLLLLLRCMCRSELLTGTDRVAGGGFLPPAAGAPSAPRELMGCASRSATVTHCCAGVVAALPMPLKGWLRPASGRQHLEKADEVVNFCAAKGVDMKPGSGLVWQTKLRALRKCKQCPLGRQLRFRNKRAADCRAHLLANALPPLLLLLRWRRLRHAVLLLLLLLLALRSICRLELLTGTA